MATNRRNILKGMTCGAAAFTAPGLFAETLMQTASTTEGPYYPDKMPLDTDNDLLLINEKITPAVGEITHFTGRLLSESGAPIRNAFIEIWQTDIDGNYLHSQGRNDGAFDGNFQGYGRFLTDSQGRYYFRTIKPVAYTLQGQFRAPHIHVVASKSGERVLTTQALVKGDEANERDFLINRMIDSSALDTLMVEYQPLPGSQLGELTANFDMIIGHTAQELEDGTLGGLGEAQRGFGGFGGRGRR